MPKRDAYRRKEEPRKYRYKAPTPREPVSCESLADMGSDWLSRFVFPHDGEGHRRVPCLHEELGDGTWGR